MSNASAFCDVAVYNGTHFSVGRSKARVITDCRAAIKHNNVAQLIKVIRTGAA